MDTRSAPPRPVTPAELVAAVTCPVARVVWVTNFGRERGSLPSEWAAQRFADLRLILAKHPQSHIVAKTGLSRVRVSQLAARALGECTP